VLASTQFANYTEKTEENREVLTMTSKRKVISVTIGLILATLIVITTTIEYTSDYSIDSIKTKIIDKFGNELNIGKTPIQEVEGGSSAEVVADLPKEETVEVPEGKDIHDGPLVPIAMVEKPKDEEKQLDNGLENAVIFSLVRNSELEGMLSSIAHLESRFNYKYHYPWFFANNEPFDEEFKQRISEAVSGETKFIEIPQEYWSYPDFIDQEKAKISRMKAQSDKIMYGGSESYRHMCRFNSGFFYRLKELESIDYYWRVEPDVKFKCDIPDDPFRRMRKEGKIYGFNMGLNEDSRTISTLWRDVKQFFKTNPELLSEPNNMKFLSDDDGESYNLCHFWSNFEIGDLNFFRSEAYSKFFEYLDKKGGFFYERWGDAPFHTIAVSLLLPPDKLMFVPYTGYYHKPNQDCPRDSKIHEELNCNCKVEKDFTWHKWSCINKYFEVNGLEKLNGGGNGDLVKKDVRYEAMDDTLGRLFRGEGY